MGRAHERRNPLVSSCFKAVLHIFEVRQKNKWRARGCVTKTKHLHACGAMFLFVLFARFARRCQRNIKCVIPFSVVWTIRASAPCARTITQRDGDATNTSLTPAAQSVANGLLKVSTHRSVRPSMSVFTISIARLSKLRGAKDIPSRLHQAQRARQLARQLVMSVDEALFLF